MTAAEYTRVRRYERLLTIWGMLNNLMNEPDYEPPQEVVDAWRVLPKYLSREQEHFERTVEDEP